MAQTIIRVSDPDQAQVLRTQAAVAMRKGSPIVVAKSYRNALGLHFVVNHPHHMAQEQLEQLLLKGGANG